MHTPDARNNIPSKEYTILEGISPDCLRFRCQGMFEERRVTWEVTLDTLARYTTAPAQQCIDIDTTAIDPVRVHITLALPTLRTTDIQKTIIMLRQYKRLRRGRHCYGPHYTWTDKDGIIIYTET